MQSISFGNIFKVNTPASVAMAAIDAASKHNEKFKNFEILGDPNKAHVVMPNRNDVYIFTEEDGEGFWKSFGDVHNHMVWARKNCPDELSYDVETYLAFQKHDKWIEKHIENCRSKIINLDITYDTDYENGYQKIIKSIDIEA